MQYGRPMRGRLVLLLALAAQQMFRQGIAITSAAHAIGRAEDANDDRAILYPILAGASEVEVTEAARVHQIFKAGSRAGRLAAEAQSAAILTTQPCYLAPPAVPRRCLLGLGLPQQLRALAPRELQVARVHADDWHMFLVRAQERVAVERAGVQAGGGTALWDADISSHSSIATTRLNSHSVTATQTAFPS